MVAWMRHRGHAWSICLEMAAAMIAPAIPLCLLRVADVISGSVCGAYCGLSLVAMGLDDAHVVIDGVDEAGTECSGTSTHPTAAPGFLCMYPYSVSNVTENEGAIWGSGDGTRWGFQVSLDVTSTTQAYWFANWAYHARNAPVARPIGRRAGCATSGTSRC